MLLLRVRLSPGYCWSFCFQATWSLSLCRIFHTPGPAMTVYSRHHRQLLEDDQQYPPVCAPGWRPMPQGQPRGRTIHSNNLCPLASFSPCFLTPSMLLPMHRSRHPFLSLLTVYGRRSSYQGDLITVILGNSRPGFSGPGTCPPLAGLPLHLLPARPRGESAASACILALYLLIESLTKNRGDDKLDHGFCRWSRPRHCRTGSTA